MQEKYKGLQKYIELYIRRASGIMKAMNTIFLAEYSGITRGVGFRCLILHCIGYGMRFITFWSVHLCRNDKTKLNFFMTIMGNLVTNTLPWWNRLNLPSWIKNLKVCTAFVRSKNCVHISFTRKLFVDATRISVIFSYRNAISLRCLLAPQTNTVMKLYKGSYTATNGINPNTLRLLMAKGFNRSLNVFESRRNQVDTIENATH